MLAFPPAASAQLPSDPPADSPSGTVYEIPLDGARRDAAPRGGGAGGSGTTGSIRSENNFGSSSQVPGAPVGGGGDTSAAQAAGDGGRAGAGSPRAGGGASGRAADGGRGSGGSAGATGAGALPGAGTTAAGATADTDGAEAAGPSTGVSIALLAAILLVGLAVGATSARHARSRP